MREHEFKTFEKVLVRDGNGDPWKIDLFSHFIPDGDYKYFCLNNHWKFCLPYEGNEDLLGTTNSPSQPEPEFKFGDHVEVLKEGSDDWYRAVFIAKVFSPLPYYVLMNANPLLRNFKFCRHADW